MSKPEMMTIRGNICRVVETIRCRNGRWMQVVAEVEKPQRHWTIEDSERVTGPFVLPFEDKQFDAHVNVWHLCASVGTGREAVSSLADCWE